MPIDIHRRQAFTNAFRLYPEMLMQFARNNCDLLYAKVGVKDEYDHVEKTPEINDKIAQVNMAQYCLRLFRTRAREADAPIQQFAKEATERYHDYMIKLFGSGIILAPPEYREALLKAEQGMTEIIFHSLSEEARIVEEAYKLFNETRPEDRQAPPEDVDEGSFWHDVYLGLADLQKPSHPNWREPINFVILDHVNEMKAAFNPQ